MHKHVRAFDFATTRPPTCRYVANLAQMKWHLAIRDVKEMQAETHTRALDLITHVDAITSARGQPPTQSELNQIFGQFADSVLSAVWATADTIMFRWGIPAAAPV